MISGVDLEEAISLYRQALLLEPPGHDGRWLSLHQLGAALYEYHQRTGDMGDFEEAISMYREALELRPLPDPERADSLNNLAVSLRDRYQRTRGMADLQEAILLGREALELRPSSHPDRPYLLWNHSFPIEDMYDATGVLSDLQESITIYEELLDSHFPVGHERRVETLGRLADLLQKRFYATGQQEDLAHIVALKDEISRLSGSTSNTVVPSSSRIIGVARKHNRFISWCRRIVS
jgi:tetratricopeptide (TPR) repeat protein